MPRPEGPPARGAAQGEGIRCYDDSSLGDTCVSAQATFTNDSGGGSGGCISTTAGPHVPVVTNSGNGRDGAARE